MAGATLRSVCVLVLSLGVCLAGITVKVTPEVHVIKGGTARLPCSYTTSDSSALVVVNWFIESAGSRKRVAYRSSIESGVSKDTQFTGRVTIETDMTLVISDTSVEDERSFFCQASGAVGVKEERTDLKVFFPPQKPVVTGNDLNIFVTQDNEDTSQVGTCTSMNGHPPPRIIWFKDSMPLPEVTDPKEKTYMVPRVVKESSGLFTVSSTLNMHLTKEDAKSVFHCTVEYMMPNSQIKKDSSDNFNLTLHYPLENVFFTLLTQNPIKEGDDVEMKCETDGNPQPPFEFYHGDKPIPSKDGLLTVKKVTRNDAGTYKCDALDFDTAVDPSELSKSLTINVHHLDPVSIVPAGPLTVKKGDTVEVQCKSKSPDPFILEWTKNDKKLHQSGVLALETVTLADAGEYVCTASVPSVPGLLNRANITIRVKGKPEIDAPMHGEVRKEGEEVTLKCSARGFPAPQFTWKPSGKESVTVDGYKTISTVTLKATAAVLKDGVTCEATNPDGSDSKKFLVEVKSDNAVDPHNGGRAESQEGGSSGVVIAVVVCVLLLLLLVASLYFLSKRGKIPCSKADKKEHTTGEVKDNIVVEMKSDGKPNGESEPLNKHP
ncbi:basal cell adhesion molecule [Salminus brasiliensis]|uniref:basal cell adhesion molecule n=1 Tax=Salminus brasiliensis TaxID=930266 RepID=UPI003B837B9E